MNKKLIIIILLVVIYILFFIMLYWIYNIHYVLFDLSIKIKFLSEKILKSI